MKHVGHHFEQLALFCLPMELFTNDASDGSDGHSNYDGQHSVHASSNNGGESQAQASDQSEDSDNLTLRAKIALNSDYRAVSSATADSMRPPSPAMPEPSLRKLSVRDKYETLCAQIQVQETERIARENDIRAGQIEFDYKGLADLKRQRADMAKVALEKAQQELEEAQAVAKTASISDMERAPIKFKDAIGRRFSFPWHLFKTWQGMESLIKQALLHVDIIGDHV
jgi:hypothetical protein